MAKVTLEVTVTQMQAIIDALELMTDMFNHPRDLQESDGEFAQRQKTVEAGFQVLQAIK